MRLVGCSGRLGRNFNGGVKVERAPLATRPHGALARTGNPESVFAQTAHMDLDGALDSAKCCVDRLAGRDTPGKIRHRRSPVAAGVAVDPNKILNSPHDFVPFRPGRRFTDALHATTLPVVGSSIAQ